MKNTIATIIFTATFTIAIMGLTYIGSTSYDRCLNNGGNSHWCSL